MLKIIWVKSSHAELKQSRLFPMFLVQSPIHVFFVYIFISPPTPPKNTASTRKTHQPPRNTTAPQSNLIDERFRPPPVLAGNLKMRFSFSDPSIPLFTRSAKIPYFPRFLDWDHDLKQNRALRFLQKKHRHLKTIQKSPLTNNNPP